MKLLKFISLLQGIMHNTIDEIEKSAGELTEETVEQDESKLDVAAFDYILNVITNMKTRYLAFKETVNSHPTFDERLTRYNLSLADDTEDDEDGEEGSGGLH